MKQKGIIVILENDPVMLQRLGSDLVKLGYPFVPGAFPNVEIGAITRLSPIAVLLGLSEWDDDRLAACETLLENGDFSKETPVIGLIAENTLRKIPRKFEFADIVIPPYRLTELEFRLNRTVYRYQQRLKGNIVIAGDIAISLAGYEVRIKGVPTSLTLKEYELLKHLAINRGRVYTRDALLNTIWGYDYVGGTRTVDVHIRRVRAKIGDLEETYIKTIRGVGYLFQADV